MSVASVKTAPQKAEHSEILDVLGPRIQFLTALSDDNGAYCLIRGGVPAGVVVPLHSHPERETFYVLGGEIEGFWEARWSKLGVGDVCDVENKASARVMEKAGLEREGMLRHWIIHPNISCKPRDWLSYAKVR